ncbi:hypothetical protein MP228_000504 [Amoeboaphelidium protococcarum]|nr:hypothetical protein MP228_000504 [Amoeboaphelidium protococcarum]
MSQDQTTTSGRHTNFTPLFQQFVIEQNERRAQLPSNPNPPPEQVALRDCGFACILSSYGFWYILSAATAPSTCLAYGIGLVSLPGVGAGMINVVERTRFWRDIADTCRRNSSNSRRDVRGNTRRRARNRHSLRSQARDIILDPAVSHQNLLNLITEAILNEEISGNTIEQWIRENGM